MPSCGFIKPKASRVCVGKMDQFVQAYSRKITPAEISHTQDLKPAFNFWAMIETRRGTSRFDGVNVERGADTTVFRTHYGVKFAKKQILKFNNKYFEVDRIENLNEENRFLEVTAIELGDIFDSDGTTPLGANLSL